MKEILKALYDELEMELKNLKTKGIILLEEKEFYKTKVTFNEWSITSKGTSSVIETITQTEIDWLKFYNFIREDFKKNAVYKKCLSSITEKYMKHERSVDWTLEYFLREIAQHILNGTTEDQKEKNITIFLKDLNEEPQNWKTKEYLNGIWVEEQVQLDGLTLRKPLPSDFEKIIPKERIPFTPISDHIDLCDFIIEMSTNAVTSEEIHRSTRIILLYLKMYKLGSIYSVYREYIPKSFTQHASIGKLNTTGYSTMFHYAINKDDEEKLNAFIRKLETLSKTKDLLEIIDKSKPLRIALSFLNSALLEAKSTEHRITNSISCLEALYLSGPTGELKRRLSQRVAVIMKYFGFSPTEVFDDVKSAYDIRSKYVHGVSLKQNQILKASEIIENVVQYSRVSFLVFLQMKNQYSKEKLLDTLDKAMLDEKISNDFHDIVTSQCLIHL